MKIYILFITSLFLLSSCAITKSSAPIEYNHKNSTLQSSNSTNYNLNKEDDVISNDLITYSDDSEFINPNSKNDNLLDEDNYIMPEERQNEAKFIYHEVNIDETIEDVAKQYNKTVKEIAITNDLLPPYYLDAFQILKIKTGTSKKKKFVLKKPQAQKSQRFIRPIDGSIVSKFGEKTSRGKNKGVNIAAKQGTKVMAAAQGKVIYADYDATFGNLVIIKLDDNVITSYAHLQDLTVSKGDYLSQGDIVGYVGNSGKIKKPQLHFGIREGKKAKNPLEYIGY